MNPHFQDLRTRLAEIDDLRSAGALLSWDQATYMPPGGALARGRQLSTLSRLAHEKSIDPRIGELLEALAPQVLELPHDSFEASFVRQARRNFDRSRRVPAEFEARLSDHLSVAYQKWTVARPANDWKAVQGDLEKTVELSRELAGFFAPFEHIVDPLIDFSDQGFTVAKLRPLFAELREFLVPLVEEIASRPRPRDDFLRRPISEEQQFKFVNEIVRGFGYDFERGRSDKTHHPFMTKFSLGDVRITTRAREDNFSEAFFSSLHEAGHALYEQNIDPRFEATPLADGASSGVHEAQSRLWENLVGRSRAFSKYLQPRLQAEFPAQFGDVSSDEFYAAVNSVGRSLIRTDADEVTYNLHVMIRFELECALLEGSLQVADLPQAWREKYKSYLNIEVPDDRDGVLQDVHWFGGTVGGAFQGYTLGNILSAQLFERVRADEPSLDEQIERGEFNTLLTWLRDHVYRYGAQFEPSELVERATGSALGIEPYRKYLQGKFGALYQL